MEVSAKDSVPSQFGPSLAFPSLVCSHLTPYALNNLGMDHGLQRQG